MITHFHGKYILESFRSIGVSWTYVKLQCDPFKGNIVS